MGRAMLIQEWLLSLSLALIAAYALQLALSSGESWSERAASGTKMRQISRGPIMRIMFPLIFVLGQFISGLPLGKGRERLEKKLIQAGRPAGLTADEFHATRVLAIVFGVLVGLFFDNELSLSPIGTGLLGSLGMVYPDIWLRDAMAKRRRRIFRDLPDVLDTLRLAVEAGMDLSSALNVVVEKGRRGPLLDELELVDREITLGLTRRDAFRNFADRIMMAEVNSFVLALIQAEQLGASIGPVLKTQSEMARTRRWQLAEALVNKMPMKMLGPLVLFIFPSSFIILFTPLIIQWMQTD